MAENNEIVIAFDLYGTLLSTASVAKKLGELYGEDKASQIAAEWRRYQLEYTWRLNSMKKYEPFSSVTQHSLIHAARETHGIVPSKEQISTLMQTYDALSTFDDVKPALTHIRNDPGIKAVVFSNGTRSMVSNSVHHSPDLSPHASVFKGLVLTEDIPAFKPDPRVYYHLAQQMGKTEAQMGDLWLVSGNPFDVVGARAVGMQAAWVDRAGTGWVDGLVEGEAGSPTVVLNSLETLVEEVKRFHGVH